MQQKINCASTNGKEKAALLRPAIWSAKSANGTWSRTSTKFMQSQATKYHFAIQYKRTTTKFMQSQARKKRFDIPYTPAGNEAMARNKVARYTLGTGYY